MADLFDQESPESLGWKVPEPKPRKSILGGYSGRLSRPRITQDMIGEAVEPEASAPADTRDEPLADFGKMLAGGTVKGAGATVRGAGEAVVDPLKPAENVSLLFRLARGIGLLPKPAADTANPLEEPAAALEQAGKRIEDSVSPSTKEAIRKSQPDGDITDPSSWTLGEDPSLRGYAMQGADVFGSMLPVVVASLLTRRANPAAQVAAPAMAGGAQGGGAAASQVRAMLDEMSDEQLEAQSPRYRTLLAEGGDPAAARATLTREAERWAYEATYPVSAAGGMATGAIIGKPGEKLVERIGSRAGRAAALGAVSGLEEGTQETAEGVQTMRGLNAATGMDVPVTQGSVQNFVLGAMGGGVTGGVRGAFTSPEEKGAAPAEDEVGDGGGPGAPVGERATPADWEVVDDLPATTPPGRGPGPEFSGFDRQLGRGQPMLPGPGEAPGGPGPGGPTAGGGGPGAFIQGPTQEQMAQRSASPDVLAAQRRGVMPTDILSRFGTPFLLRSSAEAEAERTGGQVVEVDDGFVVRPETSDVAAGRDGIAVGPAVGADVPQPVAGPAGRMDSAPAAGRRGDGDGVLPDAAGLAGGADAGVRAAHAPDVGGVRPRGGAAAVAPKPRRTREQVAADRKRAYRDANPFRAFLGEFGVHTSERSDAGGDPRKPVMIPYHGAMFRNSGMHLDELARRAVEAGFLTQADIDSEFDNGGVNKLADMIRRELAGERIMPIAQAEDTEEARWREQSESYWEAMNEAEDAVAALTDDEINALLQIASDEDAEVSNEEIDIALESGDAQESGAGAQEVAPGSAAGGDSARGAAARDQGSAEVGFGLTAPTPDQFRREAADAEAQARREGAPPPEDFTLTGSNRTVDQTAARGQMELAPAPDTSNGNKVGAPSLTQRAEAALTEKKAESEQSRRGIGRDGKTEADRADARLRSNAAELAAQLAAEVKEDDFDPAEVRPALEAWAKEANVPADDLRQAVLKRIADNDGLSASHKKRIADALSPTKAAAQAEKQGTLVSRANAALKGKIEDVGEKIGGARKDLASPTGRRKTKAEDEAPGWRKRYEVSQITKSTKPAEEGRWVIYDKRQKDRLGQPRQAVRDTFETKEKAEAAVPLIEVARNHYATPVSVQKGEHVYEIVRKVTDRKRVKVVDQQFPTREAAMLYMAQHAVEIIETKTSFGEEILPAPDKVKRTGPARRQGDATAEQFKDTFGFRAVEFGNWNSQEERQEVMNHAFDGLADLAEVLGIPTRAIGLNGELALAFGARGSGLTGARAHYERDYAVINLTKMHGAGSLAHEWMHALDHYLARQDTKASSERVKNERGDMVFKTGSPTNDMASHGFRVVKSGVRPELRDAYTALIETMYRKAEQYVEDTQKADRFVAQARKEVQEHLDRIRADIASKRDSTYYKRNNAPASAEQLAAFDEIARKVVDGEAIEMRLVTSESKSRRMSSSMRWSNDALEGISKILKAVRGIGGFDATNRSGTLDRLRDRIQIYGERLKMLAQAQSSEVKTKKVPTSFAMAAKSIDQGRASDYWSTPHEMAARAFQSYVLDKIAQRGGTSDFLTYGAENLVIPTPWGWQRPFPAGAERQAINAAFDKLVDVLQTKETGSGVAIYQPRAQYSAHEEPAQIQLDLPIAPRDDTVAGRSTTGRRVSNRARATRAVRLQTTPDPEGVYHARTDLVAERTKTLPVDVVKTPQQAALALASVADYAVEHFHGLVTNKAGKPLALIGMFKGGLASTSVHIETLLGEAFRIQGAANLWLTHNHPSGAAEFSAADKMLFGVVSRAFAGTGIAVRGMFAQTYSYSSRSAGRWVFMDNTQSLDQYGQVIAADINAAASKTAVPVVERVVTKFDPGAAVSSPIAAKDAARQMAATMGDRPFVMLLSTQNEVIGAYPLTPGELSTLRQDERAANLFRAVSLSNAGASIIVDPKGELDRDAEVVNIGNALSEANAPTLDFLRKKPGAQNFVSEADRGRWQTPRGPFFSRRTDAAAHEAATSPLNDHPEPTEAQKDAGNYPKGHLRIAGLDISIENPAGTHRRPEWPALPAHYGYIRGTIGKDGDHVDVFVREGTPEDFDGPVFIIDQTKADGGFDEHKVMLGWRTQVGAARAYRAAFTKGWKGLGAITRASLDAFKGWLASGKTKRPFARTVDAAGRSGQDVSRETATEAHREAVGRLQAALRANVDGADAGRAIDALRAAKVPDHLAAGIGRLERMFGVQIVFVDGAERLSADQQFNGVYIGGKTLYVSSTATKPLHFVIGHEFLHHLKQTNRALYDEFVDRVRPYLLARRAQQYADKRAAEYNDLAESARAEVGWEETFADSWGAAWHDPGFWQSMAAREPSLFKRIVAKWKMFVTRVRMALSGNKDTEEVRGLFTDFDAVRDIVADIAGRATPVEVGTSAQHLAPAFSRKDDPAAFAADVLAELSEYDEMYRSARSQRLTLDGVMAEAFPDAKYLGEDTRPDEKQESGADIRHVFRTGLGKNLYVFERDQDVWMDVSRLAEGELGGRFYAGVLNYAYNTGKRFIGDPAGLSEAAVVRRTSAMLSSALRFGTTKHMDAAPEQRSGIPEKGIAPLKWGTNDVENVKAMIESFLSTLYTQFPALKGYRYDFAEHRFVDRRGRPLDAARLERGEGSPDARGARAGEATLRRGIFLQSLVSSARSERPGLLEEVLSRGRSLVTDGDLGAMFSRRTDASDPGIRFSRRTQAAQPPVSDPRVGPIDTLLRGAGGKLLSDKLLMPLWDRLIRAANRLTPEAVKQGLVSDYGLDEPYMDVRAATRAAINKQMRSAKSIIDLLAGLDREQSRVAYQWMTERPDAAAERAMMDALPEDSRAVMQRMKAMVHELGRAAVRAGLLSEEAFERNEYAYLHRSYRKHEAESAGADGVHWKTRAKLRAETFKGRGLRHDIDQDRLMRYADEVKAGDKFTRFERRRADGKLAEVRYVPVGKPMPPELAGWANDGAWEARWMGKPTATKVGMYRDFTKAERERMGEIEEVRYAFAKTMLHAVQDIEHAKFLQWVAQEYGEDPETLEAAGQTVHDGKAGYINLRTYSPDEWVKVPATKIPDTNLRAYGALAGRAVPAPIWNDIRSQFGSRPETMPGKVYDSTLRAWKMSKTALSPAVHMNNVMANVILADLADIRATDMIEAFRVLRAAKRGDAAAKALVARYEDSGAEQGSLIAQELRLEAIEPLLAELASETDRDLGLVKVSQLLSMAAHGDVAAALQGLKSKKAVKAAAIPFKVLLNAYRMEDSVFRLAAFIRHTADGMSDLKAGQVARDAFLNYEINAPWINALRRGPLPFIAFSYRAIPMLMKAAVQKPWKIAKYAGIAAALNAAAYMLMGMGDDDERRERALLPEEKSGRVFGIFPRLMRMPWNDEHGSPVFLDVRRWLPAGDVFDVQQSQAAVPLPGWLTASGPLGLFMELMLNKSSFTGNQIVLETDTTGEAMAKVLSHVNAFMQPNLPIPNPLGWLADDEMAVPGIWQTYSWAAIEQAHRGATDAFRRERSMSQALLSSIGIKLASYPQDAARMHEALKYKANKSEIGRQINSINRQEARGGLDADEAAAKREAQQQKLKRINQRLLERLRAAD